MDPEGNNHDERAWLISEIYRIVGQVEKRFDDLRNADLLARSVAFDGVQERLEGFPQQFATKIEMEEAGRAVRRLENDALSREMYDQQRQALLQTVSTLDRDKLAKAVFDTFVENYRIEQDRAGTERRNVADVLATATDKVRAENLETRGEYITVESYDQQHNTILRRVESVERWEYKLVGGLVFATFLAPLVTGLVVYVVTKGIG